jgi:hypothetical protein
VIRFGGVIKADGAKGVTGPSAVGEAGFADELQHAGRAREACDGGVEIRVGAGVAGYQTAEPGEKGFEVEIVDCTEEAFWLVALEDAELATRTEDAEEFGKPLLIVGEVAKAEGGGDEIDGGVGEGKVKSVAFDGDDVVTGKFLFAEGEHLVGEVDGEDRGGVGSCGAMLEKSHRHVTGAAAEVEDDGFGMLKDWAEEEAGAAPPGAVDADGEKVVGAVVGGSDGVEHLLHVCGGGLFCGRADGTGSGGEFVLGRILGCHSSMLDGWLVV